MPEANTILFYDRDGRICFFRRWDGSESGGLRGRRYNLRKLIGEMKKTRQYFSEPYVIEAGIPKECDAYLGLRELKPADNKVVEIVGRILHGLN